MAPASDSLASLGFAPLDDDRVGSSALGGRLIVLLGVEEATAIAGRALGTTPGVRFAEAPTEIFSRGLAQLVGSYTVSLLPGPGQGAGLAALFDPRALVGELRVLADRLLLAVRGDAAIVVDHGAGLTACIELLELVYPDALIVYVDPGSTLVEDSLRRRRPRRAIEQAVEREQAAAELRELDDRHATLTLDRLRAAPADALAPLLAAVDHSAALDDAAVERAAGASPPGPGLWRGAAAVAARVARGRVRRARAR